MRIASSVSLSSRIWIACHCAITATMLIAIHTISAMRSGVNQGERPLEPGSGTAPVPAAPSASGGAAAVMLRRPEKRYDGEADRWSES